MHFAVLGIYPGPGGEEWFVWCETCARGSRTSASRKAVRDLLAAHLIDPHASPVDGVDPESFTPPSDLMTPPPRYL